MADFIPPLNPDQPPAPLSPTVPLNPPMVGFASPFHHVDGQNRDLILEAIRAWSRGSLLDWIAQWRDYLIYWTGTTEGWLNLWSDAVTAYVTEALADQLEMNQAAIDQAVTEITDALAASNFFGNQTEVFDTNHSQMLKAVTR